MTFDGVGLGGDRELLGAADRVRRQARDAGDLAGRGGTAELLRQLGRGAAHDIHARPGATRQRVEPAQFVEHGAAHARERIGTGLVNGAVEVAQRFDERDPAGAGEVITTDGDRQPAGERSQRGVDHIEEILDARRLEGDRQQGGVHGQNGCKVVSSAANSRGRARCGSFCEKGKEKGGEPKSAARLAKEDLDRLNLQQGREARAGKDAEASPRCATSSRL